MQQVTSACENLVFSPPPPPPSSSYVFATHQHAQFEMFTRDI
jgi:hypothetical protein